jgi:hypothetical protein
LLVYRRDMETTIDTKKKFYTVTWSHKVGKLYERNEQTVPEAALRMVIAAVKRLPGVPSSSVRYQGAP